MDEEKRNQEDNKYFVFKANVPLDDSAHMLAWTKSCQDKTPVGHNNYRWGKMLHDHLFVIRFKEELDQIKKSQAEIIRLLTEERSRPGKEKTYDGLFGN